ncbi:MAG: GGDEF domain-containing protein [Gammaproteobacteria bacterium]|nr:GGDEF domain-containing protein [Gammaproteobacteria bacterium]
MRYKDPHSKSIEYLRLTIPLISKYKTTANPINYTVWYEYVTGANIALKRDIDSLLKKGQTINDEQLEALYIKHISECDEDGMKRLHLDMRRLLGNLSDLATHTGDEASRFDHSLENYVHQLDDEDLGVEAVQGVIGGLLGDTRSMRHSITSMQGQLEESKHLAQGLRDELKRAREEALTDALTGLINRKGFSKAIDEVTSQTTDHPNNSCLLMIDIDHFKRVNDSYGHLLGDKVIQFVAATLKKRVKGKDTAARYGGEELAVLLLEITLAGACAVGEDIRRTIEKGRILRLDNKQPIGGITVSVGVAQYRAGESADTFISRADEALYASKNQGRNRVTADPDNS